MLCNTLCAACWPSPPTRTLHPLPRTHTSQASATPRRTRYRAETGDASKTCSHSCMCGPSSSTHRRPALRCSTPFYIAQRAQECLSRCPRFAPRQRRCLESSTSLAALQRCCETDLSPRSRSFATRSAVAAPLATARPQMARTAYVLTSPHGCTQQTSRGSNRRPKRSRSHLCRNAAGSNKRSWRQRRLAQHTRRRRRRSYAWPLRARNPRSALRQT
eukprot:6174472-Pleurochrysis_carterae.AAC.1